VATESTTTTIRLDDPGDCTACIRRRAWLMETLGTTRLESLGDVPCRVCGQTYTVLIEPEAGEP
jgi:hypothetical protein